MNRRTFLKIVGLAVAGVGLPKETGLTVADIRKCRDELEKNPQIVTIWICPCAGSRVPAHFRFHIYGIDKNGKYHLLGCNSLV